MQPSPGAPAPSSVRRWAVLWLLLAAVLAAAAIYFVAAGDRVAPPSIGGGFNLVDGDGRAVDDRSFRGRYMLVYFGYTSCPDICPTTLTQIADAMDRLGAKADRVQPLFITIDPQRDTPAVIARYTAAFSPRLEGLTGSPDQIAQAARAYRVYYAPHRTGPGPDDYSMDHSSIVYLMGPDGSFLAPIPADASGAEMAAQIGRLLS